MVFEHVDLRGFEVELLHALAADVHMLVNVKATNPFVELVWRREVWRGGPGMMDDRNELTIKSIGYLVGLGEVMGHGKDGKGRFMKCSGDVGKTLGRISMGGKQEAIACLSHEHELPGGEIQIELTRLRGVTHLVYRTLNLR